MKSRPARFRVLVLSLGPEVQLGAGFFLPPRPAGGGLGCRLAPQKSEILQQKQLTRPDGEKSEQHTQGIGFIDTRPTLRAAANANAAAWTKRLEPSERERVSYAGGTYLARPNRWALRPDNCD